MPQFEKAYRRLHQYVERFMQMSVVPGISLALTNRMQLLYTSTYGLADIERQLPVTPETLFEIGSISKSFTCIALLQLQDEGKLDIHAPVTEYLPWFQVQTQYAPITIHHLMSHTAGIMSGVDSAPTSRYSVHLLRDMATAYAPGTHYHYSNVAFQALGYVLEAVEGRSYAEIIHARILAPLGMEATEPVMLHRMRAKLAVGYNPLYDDRPQTVKSPLVPATWLECGAGDGSISSTASDMTRYLRLLLNKGEPLSVLGQHNYEHMTQKVIAMAPGRYYGYGLMVGEQDGYATIGHTGDMVGYRSIMIGDIEHGLGVVVLVNGSDDPTPIAKTALRLLRAAYRDEQLPDVPVVAAPATVENAHEYVGEYRGLGKNCTIKQDGQQLMLVYGDDQVVLERLPVAPDCFYANHSAFELFPLQFSREGGVVVEVIHGDVWYRHTEHMKDWGIVAPLTWQQFTGHYRAYNPWHTNFRVVLRRGQLYLIEATGFEQVLTPLDESTFRVGDAQLSPESIHFDTVIQDQAQRATYSGGEFFRTFTP